jgi:hypothetical protein
MKQLATIEQLNLNKNELLAIEMRYQGKSSREISESTGYSESSVRRLFMTGGRLEDAYNQYLQQRRIENQAIANAALQTATQEAGSAIERIIALSKNPINGPVCYKANEYLLNIAGVGQEAGLYSYLKALTYEQALSKLNAAFMDLFGKCMSSGTRVYILQPACKNPSCDFNNKTESEEENGK